MINKIASFLDYIENKINNLLSKTKKEVKMNTKQIQQLNDSFLTLEKIINDQKEAYDSNTSSERLIELFKNNDLQTQMLCVSHPNCPDSLIMANLTHENPKVRMAILHKEKLPNEVFYILANDSEVSVRSFLASHLGCPEEVLKSLINDHKYVRMNLCLNKNLPDSISEELKKDEDQDVANLARKNFSEFRFN